MILEKNKKACALSSSHNYKLRLGVILSGDRDLDIPDFKYNEYFNNQSSFTLLNSSNAFSSGVAKNPIE